MESERKEEHNRNEHHKRENQISSRSKNNFDTNNILIIAGIVLGILLITNLVLASSLKAEFKKNAEAAMERAKPAKIELAVIKNSKCNDCFDISAFVSNIKSANTNITKQSTLEFDSKEGKEIISKYNIAKVPTVIVTGEIEKVSIQGLEKKENALLLTSLKPPYTNAATGKIEGRVILYQLSDPECKKCSNLTLLINQIKGSGVKIYEEKIITPASDEGNDLTTKYKIDFAPTIILSKDASAYEIIQQAWPQVGSKESDENYVLRSAIPPFINLTTNKLRGLVNIIYLTDKSCAGCYDVNLHKEILANPQSFAMKIDKEETVDISDSKGKELLANYNITQVPTIILSDEVSAYPSGQALKQFFSIEKDGSYVFRKFSSVGTYKDLTTNEVVKAHQQAQQSSEV